MAVKPRDWFPGEAKKIGAALANDLPGRTVGDPAAEPRLARAAGLNSPYVLANYANCFPDGREAKSTSIGLCDESGKYVAGGVSLRQLPVH